MELPENVAQESTAGVLPMNPDLSGSMAENSARASKFLKSISNQQRLMILCMLDDKELSVGEINAMLPDLSQSALSQHLAVLRKDGLVDTRRKSQAIYYRLASTEAMKIIHVLHELFCSEDCA